MHVRVETRRNKMHSTHKHHITHSNSSLAVSFKEDVLNQIVPNEVAKDLSPKVHVSGIPMR